jgi:mRNA-degrading endonuclease RelE of RelBE toxin-antitoxin system
VKFEMSKEVPNGLSDRNNISKKVFEFLNSDNKCLTIECENEKETASAYNTIYAMSKRRHDIPIRRFRRGNTVIITKIDETKEHSNLQQ